MLFADVFICVGLLWIVFIPSMYLGWVGRAITGFGSGISSFAVPLYISEIVPDKYNKKLVAFYGIFSSVGLVGGLNLAIPFRHHWKILFEVGCAPAAIQLIIVFFLPESQNYYINNGNDAEALKVIKLGMSDVDAERELRKLKFERKFYVSEVMTSGRKWKDLIYIYWYPLIIVTGLSFFSQAIGTAAFIYYGPEIILNTHTDIDEIEEEEESAVILDNVIVLSFAIGNLASAYIIAHTGRKMMILIALPVAWVALLVLSYTMYEANDDNSYDSA